MPQIGGADDLSAGAFRRASLEGAMSGLTPAPTKRVHDPSRVATHGVALWSAGQSPFRSERIDMAFLVPCLRLIPASPSGRPCARPRESAQGSPGAATHGRRSYARVDWRRQGVALHCG
jgi:hypothetical protein